MLSLDQAPLSDLAHAPRSDPTPDTKLVREGTSSTRPSPGKVRCSKVTRLQVVQLNAVQLYPRGGSLLMGRERPHEPFPWSSMLPCAARERLEATERISTAMVVRAVWVSHGEVAVERSVVASWRQTAVEIVRVALHRCCATVRSCRHGGSKASSI